MAVKLETKNDVGRGDLYLIDPNDIVIDENLNGRWLPHSEDEIDELAASILETGQLQAVQIRKDAANVPHLVFGYRRYLAFKKINKGKNAQDRLKIKCVLVQVNDEEAFRNNIIENKNRKNTSPIDDCHNQRRLREDYGWSDTRIAEFYKCSPAYVSLLKKLLLLPEDIKLKVHRKELAINTAAALVDLTPGEREEALAPEPPELVLPAGGEGNSPPEGGEVPATKGKGKNKRGRKEGQGKGGAPSSKTVLKRVNKIKRGKASAGGEGGKSTPRASRSLAEVRKFFSAVGEGDHKKLVKEVAAFLLKYVNGTYTDDTAEKKFVELF